MKSHNYPGTYVIIEGMDGSGTTTITQKLANKCFEAHQSQMVSMIREPTYGSYGMQARKLLSGEKVDNLPEKMTELFTLDRYNNTDKNVKPMLEQSMTVLQDRGAYSTVAYQGGVQGVPYEDIFKMHEDLPFIPDIVFLLSVTLENSKARINNRNEAKEIFDEDNMLSKIHGAYEKLLEIVDKYKGILPQPIIIDANKPIDNVVNQCWEHLETLLPYNKKAFLNK